MPKMGRRGGFSHFRPCRALARLRAQKQKIIRARLPTALDKKQPQSLKSFGVCALREKISKSFRFQSNS